ncbi:phage terminase small subunit P27 family [Paenibacillus humicus]|uniref:phage terminase small subunit P27 family n=1 Tax=Paenibacillus humicus TaxID=412861 RepID=UPI000FD92976|nr:phage terminase small subunit P27 family [Paenibacillus humicus]
MGSRGPRPKPTELKVLEGTYRNDRAPVNEPKPSAPNQLPKAPPYFNATARKEWNRIGPELMRLGLLTIADMTLFEAYCLSYSRHAEATKSLKKAGTMFHEYTNKAGATNFVQRPEIAVIQKEAAVIKMLCAEFGLSPAARARMEAPTILPTGGAPPAGNPDSFSGYLNGPRKRDLPRP